MKIYTRLSGFKKLVAAGVIGMVFQFPFTSCDLGEFTTTTTTTLDGREVVSFLVRTAILTPIETVVNTGVNAFFDRFDKDDD